MGKFIRDIPLQSRHEHTVPHDWFGLAFANSVGPSHVVSGVNYFFATILIGERDDGTPEDIDPDGIRPLERVGEQRVFRSN